MCARVWVHRFVMEESKKQLLGGSNPVTFTMCKGVGVGAVCQGGDVERGALPDALMVVLSVRRPRKGEQVESSLPAQPATLQTHPEVPCLGPHTSPHSFLLLSTLHQNSHIHPHVSAKVSGPTPLPGHPAPSPPLMPTQPQVSCFTSSHTLFTLPCPLFRRYLDPRHYQVIQHFRLLDIADYVHCMAYDAPGKHSTMAFAKQASSQGLRFARSVFGIRNLSLLGFLRGLGI